MSLPHNCRSENSGRGIRLLRSTPRGFFALLALALSCLAPPAPAAAAELGRLFLTPQQREDLDRRRATNRAEEEAPKIQEGPLTLDGHVQRSSGKSATWISGVPEFDGKLGRDPARATVVPNVGEPGISLKVGEIYDRASGTVRDNLGGGKVTAGKAAPRSAPGTASSAKAKPPAPSR